MVNLSIEKMAILLLSMVENYALSLGKVWTGGYVFENYKLNYPVL